MLQFFCSRLDLLPGDINVDCPMFRVTLLNDMFISFEINYFTHLFHKRLKSYLGGGIGGWDSGNDFCQFLFLRYMKEMTLFLIKPRRNNKKQGSFLAVSNQKRLETNRSELIGARRWGRGREIGVEGGLGGRDGWCGYTGKEGTHF